MLRSLRACQERGSYPAAPSSLPSGLGAGTLRHPFTWLEGAAGAEASGARPQLARAQGGRYHSSGGPVRREEKVLLVLEASKRNLDPAGSRGGRQDSASLVWAHGPELRLTLQAGSHHEAEVFPQTCHPTTLYTGDAEDGMNWRRGGGGGRASEACMPAALAECMFCGCAYGHKSPWVQSRQRSGRKQCATPRHCWTGGGKGMFSAHPLRRLYTQDWTGQM